MGQIWVLNSVIVVAVHVLALYGVFTCSLSKSTALLVQITWALSSVGITAGYHRLWSHRTYEAGTMMRLFLAIAGTLAMQGSIKWWVLRHRLHHRYHFFSLSNIRFTDSADDPYNATEGFWFSHIGWIFYRPSYKKFRLVKMDDINGDPIAYFQHRFYFPLVLVLCVICPLIFGYIFGDMRGAFFYGFCWSRLFVWHSTFFINSLAHWIGDQEYSLLNSSRGNLFLAVLTAGEGHHNFHHSFPFDYRNGILWYHYDPTKWFIYACSRLGLCWNLKVTSKEEIAMAKKSKDDVKYSTNIKDYLESIGTEVSKLPVLKKTDIDQLIGAGKIILIVENFVVDATKIMDKHPGGSNILRINNGRDVTFEFNGGLNSHNVTARLQLAKSVIGQFSSDL